LGSFFVHFGPGSPFNDNDVVLSSFILAADFDENGTVNGADLTNWKMNFGLASSASHMQGDANGDGDVDGRDLLTWQRQLGLSNLALPAIVPEPRGVVAALGLLSMLSVPLQRSKRRSQGD
jgi:hypothetical protein